MTSIHRAVLDAIPISSIITDGLVSRALGDVGATVASASPEHYESALPRIRRRLAVYFTDEDLSRVMIRISSALDRRRE
ncbi:MAG: hypothetical protein AAGE52_03790 [Myxococcota bacterium]